MTLRGGRGPQRPVVRRQGTYYDAVLVVSFGVAHEWSRRAVLPVSRDVTPGRNVAECPRLEEVAQLHYATIEAAVRPRKLAERGLIQALGAEAAAKDHRFPHHDENRTGGSN